ncbi:MAG TPA: hypothetical protein VMW66_00830 [Elusimicrobiales bacterium]|nr:hypothetical protein [Elusimicrobiales bacterium]
MRHKNFDMENTKKLISFIMTFLFSFNVLLTPMAFAKANTNTKPDDAKTAKHKKTPKADVNPNGEALARFASAVASGNPLAFVYMADALYKQNPEKAEKAFENQSVLANFWDMASPFIKEDGTPNEKNIAKICGNDPECINNFNQSIVLAKQGARAVKAGEEAKAKKLVQNNKYKTPSFGGAYINYYGTSASKNANKNNAYKAITPFILLGGVIDPKIFGDLAVDWDSFYSPSNPNNTITITQQAIKDINRARDSIASTKNVDGLKKIIDNINASSEVASRMSNVASESKEFFSTVMVEDPKKFAEAQKHMNEVIAETKKLAVEAEKLAAQARAAATAKIGELKAFPKTKPISAKYRAKAAKKRAFADTRPISIIGEPLPPAKTPKKPGPLAKFKKGKIGLKLGKWLGRFGWALMAYSAGKYFGNLVNPPPPEKKFAELQNKMNSDERRYKICKNKLKSYDEYVANQKAQGKPIDPRYTTAYGNELDFIEKYEKERPMYEAIASAFIDYLPPDELARVALRSKPELLASSEAFKNRLSKMPSNWGYETLKKFHPEMDLSFFANNTKAQGEFPNADEQALIIAESEINWQLYEKYFKLKRNVETHKNTAYAGAGSILSNPQKKLDKFWKGLLPHQREYIEKQGL